MRPAIRCVRVGGGGPSGISPGASVSVPAQSPPGSGPPPGGSYSGSGLGSGPPPSPRHRHHHTSQTFEKSKDTSPRLILHCQNQTSASCRARRRTKNTDSNSWFLLVCQVCWMSGKRRPQACFRRRKHRLRSHCVGHRDTRLQWLQEDTGRSLQAILCLSRHTGSQVT